MSSDLLLSLGFLAEFNAQTALKLLIVALAYPLWGPIARAMHHEIIEALAPEGGFLGTAERRPSQPPPAGLDPFLNVPLARHRSRAQPTSQSASAGAKRPTGGVLRPQSRPNPARPSTTRGSSRSSQVRPAAKRRSF